MSNRKRFTFTGSEADHETKMGFQVNLGETPNLSNLDQLFNDLFLEWRVDPGYLFVSEKDIEPLTQEILRGTNFCGRNVPHYGPVLSDKCRITKYINQTTGKLVHLVPLPGLEPHNVIIGFFK